MGKHSIIPPSSAKIWGAPNGCTGWVSMSQMYPETEETEESKEGTASHEIGSTLILNQAVGQIAVDAPEFVGETADNGVIFTDEMFEAAKIYADDVGEVMRSTGVFGGINFGNEKHLTMPKIHELNEGTTDQFIFDRKTGHLYVWDYKFGYEIVEAFENWQSIDYTNGIFEKLKLNDGIADQHITVHIRIVQPRAFHRDGMIREWTVRGSDLRAHFNTLEMNAAESLGPNAKCRSGAHCRHCSARTNCEAGITMGMRMYEVVCKPTPLEMSPLAAGVQLSLIKRARKQLEYLESGFEEQIKGKIRKGITFPNWIVEQGMGRERWAKPVAEVIALGKVYGKDLKKPDEVITPTQARKKGMDAEMVKSYTEKPKTGMILVEDNGDKAKRLFGEIKS